MIHVCNCFHFYIYLLVTISTIPLISSATDTAIRLLINKVNPNHLISIYVYLFNLPVFSYYLLNFTSHYFLLVCRNSDLIIMFARCEQIFSAFKVHFRYDHPSKEIPSDCGGLELMMIFKDRQQA